MNKPISNIFEVEVLAARPQISLIVPVTLQVAVDRSEESVAPDIKLPVLVEKGLLDIFLNDVGSLLAVDVCIRYNLLNLRELLADLNAATSISVFAWFHYPNLLP